MHCPSTFQHSGGRPRACHGAIEQRVVLGINLLLQCIYLPTGIIIATRAKPLVKGFGFGILVSAIPLGIIDAIFYLRASAQ